MHSHHQAADEEHGPHPQGAEGAVRRQEGQEEEGPAQLEIELVWLLPAQALFDGPVAGIDGAQGAIVVPGDGTAAGGTRSRRALCD